MFSAERLEKSDWRIESGKNAEVPSEVKSLSDDEELYSDGPERRDSR